MKPLFLIPIFLAAFCLTSYGQNTKAWKIVQKIKTEPLPGASQNAINRAKELNSRDFKIRLIVSDSLYFDSKYPIPGRYFLSNRRDSVNYTYYKKGDVAYREPYEFTPKISLPIRFPDTLMQIAGIQAEKAVIEWKSDSLKNSALKIIIWFAPNLPNWMVYWKGIPGFPLKVIKFEYDDQLKYITTTLSIEQITLKEQDYFPPEAYKIIKNNDGK